MEVTKITPETAKNDNQLFLLGLLLIAMVGISIRIFPSASYPLTGNDERLYSAYAEELKTTGLLQFPDIVANYKGAQEMSEGAMLPPTRFLYIYAGYLFSMATGATSLEALHDVACIFSILTLLLSALIAYRMAGRGMCLGVFALMACAPTQIHMSQHALIDGFFAFWALLSVWLLWESMQPDNRHVIQARIALAGSLALMVLTKENAFFVYAGLLGLTVLAPLCKYGKITPGLLAALVLGPTAGFITLVSLAGGITPFIETYSLLVTKAYNLEYAIKTGDGPWYRYLIDLLIVSPLILLLAVGSIFRIGMDRQNTIYLTLFVVLTYVIMCNIKYGMNLRYANMWDMPIRLLAVSQIFWLSAKFPKFRIPAAWTAISVVCLHQLWLYYTLFVKNPLYELITSGLLKALNILK